VPGRVVRLNGGAVMAWLRALLRSKREPVSMAGGRIELFADGFRKLSLTGPETLFEVRWEDVKEVVTWKDDLFAVDLINLGFRVTDSPEYLGVNEEELGWRELGERLPAALPALPKDWWTVVMQPPFATNWATIWGSPLASISDIRLRDR
jgi:hypothetical protein